MDESKYRKRISRVFQAFVFQNRLTVPDFGAERINNIQCLAHCCFACIKKLYGASPLYKRTRQHKSGTHHVQGEIFISRQKQITEQNSTFGMGYRRDRYVCRTFLHTHVKINRWNYWSECKQCFSSIKIGQEVIRAAACLAQCTRYRQAEAIDYYSFTTS